MGFQVMGQGGRVETVGGSSLAIRGPRARVGGKASPFVACSPRDTSARSITSARRITTKTLQQKLRSCRMSTWCVLKDALF
jgi:hypothetical protein